MDSESRDQIAKRFATKTTLANMLRGSMIVVVKDAEQAYMAETAGARAVIPIDKTFTECKALGGVSMVDLETVEDIMDSVVIPVIGRVRIGHVLEAMAMEAAQVNFIEENELMLSIGDTHISKHPFKVPFIGEASNLCDALLRIKEGASMIRTKYTGDEDRADIVKTFNTVRKVFQEIEQVCESDESNLSQFAAQGMVHIDLVRMVARLGKLPVPFFAAGGIFMPIDIAMLMSLGCDGVVVSSRAFDVISPEKRMADIASALVDYKDSAKMATIIERTGGYGKSSASRAGPATGMAGRV
ncbi:putative pyridoxine biosynthesis [Coemansia reversa NRRL 1564]|uniref:pyridoxal 5'-phosphate synthase (glutamine hydrolyzing) n=1 Tax=Coemansia reversa (strain ATCC 12441 / NRRL 1564) TaxID=763665 RepID=A0A2G5BAS0_COERN|nr:putative pyridoxine biosynthesis [Coemansia reversa NRRL 1564]|eukprot:PIA16103.1 putative pyridoxine biosynthesis [Coemansia reversa NRRL 1564]